jgi:hypothetical protein
MYPARGEPGRNGDHRPLEFFDIISYAGGIVHTILSRGAGCAGRRGESATVASAPG